MQGTYKITEVQEDRTYPNTKGAGELKVWLVGLKDARAESPHGLFELHKKADSPGPKVGDDLDVERSWSGEFSGQPYVRVKQAYTPRQGASSSSSGYGGGELPADRQRAIVRQHSQEMALRFLALTDGFKGLDPSSTADVAAALNGVVRRVTTWFEKDVQGAPAAAAPDAPSDAPPDQRGLGDDDVPF